MSNSKRGSLLIIAILLTTILLSACTQSLSSAPAKTPTVIPTGLFVSPIPSVENPMAMIEEFAKQTAAAQTVAAGGIVETGTPDPNATPDPNITPNPLSVTTLSPAVDSITPTNIIPLAGNSTPVPAGVRPSTYTLQSGEFPYCIARRFNVDPDQLISLSGLTSPDIYYAGLTLKIPQSGAFPGDRSLISHPTTYTVRSSDETLYSIACKYGDVDPAAIASTNGISVAAKLTVGQSLQIP